MIKRLVPLAAVVAALSFAGQANATYTIALSGLNPMSFGGGGTSFTFVIPSTPQTSVGDFPQPFNVINVAEPTASAGGTGFATLNENFTITGTGDQTGLSLSGTITGTFTISGALSTYTNVMFTNLVGTGFTVTSPSYTQPTAGGMNGDANSGNVSFVVIPSAVPEPASIAMLGLGLAGVGAYGLRRRSAK